MSCCLLNVSVSVYTWLILIVRLCLFCALCDFPCKDEFGCPLQETLICCHTCEHEFQIIFVNPFVLASLFPSEQPFDIPDQQVLRYCLPATVILGKLAKVICRSIRESVLKKESDPCFKTFVKWHHVKNIALFIDNVLWRPFFTDLDGISPASDMVMHCKTIAVGLLCVLLRFMYVIDEVAERLQGMSDR